MKKNWKFWAVVAGIVLAAAVFVKVAPFGVSVAGIAGFAAGAVVGWVVGRKREEA